MKASEIVVFVLYLIFMLSIGVYFFVKNKSGGEKTYFLGGRQMGPWVTALSAGASDMSAWVLMGLPTSIYALGVGQVWISVGLAIGYTISWLVEAPRLRRFSIVAGDAITIPQYLTNRFLAKSRALQILCAVIFLVAYTVYAASSIKACGTLFNTVIGMDATAADHHHQLYLPRRLFRRLLDGLLPGHAHARRAADRPDLRRLHAQGPRRQRDARGLLERLRQLEGHCLWSRLGSRLLRHAAYHHPLHVA